MWSLHDAYLSVVESLFHAGTANGAKVYIKWVDSETLSYENVEQTPGRLRRHPGARRLRRPGHRGHDRWLPSTPGSTRSLTWASAWGCRSR